MLISFVQKQVVPAKSLAENKVSYLQLQVAEEICKNCGYSLTSKYCGNCGQKATVHRIGMKALLHDIPHAIFHVDSGFFYNVRELFIRPGYAIRDYLEGKRKAFFHPVTYLAILLVLNLFAVKVTNLHYYDETELLSMSADEIAFIKEYDATQWWFLEHTYLYMLIAIPACTGFCYLFFKIFKQRFNYAEYAVIVMFIIAQGVLIQSAIYFCFGWIRNGVFIRSMEVINLLLLVLYAGYAMYQIIAPKRAKIIAGVSVIMGGFLILLIMLASAYLLLEVSYLFQ
jgi:hypothetical protein